MEGPDKVILVLRDGKIRVAKPKEITDNRTPPEVLEIIFLKEGGTWDSYIPDPLGR